MAEVISLSQVRKAKAKAAKGKKAQDNRAKFGLTKAEKAQDAHDRKARETELRGKEIPENTDN